MPFIDNLNAVLIRKVMRFSKNNVEIESSFTLLTVAIADPLEHSRPVAWSMVVMPKHELSTTRS